MDDCATSATPPIVYAGGVAYSRSVAGTSTSYSADTRLNGTLSSTQSGVTQCSVTYDNLQVLTALDFQTGEFYQTVTGTASASCPGNPPTATPTPTSTPGATPTPTPYQDGGGSGGTGTITIVCTFSGVPVNTLPATIDIHCEVTSS